MKKVVRKKKRKINKVKAGFVPGNVLLLLMFSGLSAGFFNDVFTTTESILSYQKTYEEAVALRDIKLEEKDELVQLEVKLNNYEYLEKFIRSSLFYTKENETIIIIQGNE